MVAGVPTLRILTARAEDAWALQPPDLEVAITNDLADGLLPFFFSATLGTTSSCAVEPLYELSAICEHHKLWCASAAEPSL